MKLEHSLITYTKIYSKWIKDLNLKLDIIKHLEENIGKNNKSKNKQMGLHQTKSYCPSKETINKTKRQTTEWDKIFATDIYNRGLISKIYKLKIKKINNPFLKCAE